MKDPGTFFSLMISSVIRVAEVPRSGVISWKGFPNRSVRFEKREGAKSEREGRERRGEKKRGNKGDKRPLCLRTLRVADCPRGHWGPLKV